MPIDTARRALFTLGRSPTSGGQPRLPWLADPTTFTDNCTQCQACLTHCPESIIVKGDGGYPAIDFSRGECTFCYECASQCPEPLFTARTTQPWRTTLKISDACLPKRQVVCQTCRDVCEVRAIQFPITAGVAQPTVDQELCTGCGACINSCPTQAVSLLVAEDHHD